MPNNPILRYLTVTQLYIILGRCFISVERIWVRENSLSVGLSSKSLTWPTYSQQLQNSFLTCTIIIMSECHARILVHVWHMQHLRSMMCELVHGCQFALQGLVCSVIIKRQYGKSSSGDCTCGRMLIVNSNSCKKWIIGCGLQCCSTCISQGIYYFYIGIG